MIFMAWAKKSSARLSSSALQRSMPLVSSSETLALSAALSVAVASAARRVFSVSSQGAGPAKTEDIEAAMASAPPATASAYLFMEKFPI